MALLEFHLEKTNILPDKVDITRMKEYERVKYDLPFQILIEGKEYFYDSYFAILDFFYTVLCWQQGGENTDMIYNSCETEDNPLIRFKCSSHGWRIESPWENFKCERYLTRADLYNAIDSLKQRYNLK